MMLWRPGMPLDRPGVKIPDERLYTYTDDDIEAFIEEASRFVRRHKHSRETNVNTSRTYIGSCEKHGKYVPNDKHQTGSS